MPIRELSSTLAGLIPPSVRPSLQLRVSSDWPTGLRFFLSAQDSKIHKVS
jgi:hypothetical protein